MGLFNKERKGHLTEKWRVDVQSDLLAGPMVYDVDQDGRREIVLGTKDGRVFLLDENSEVKWKYNVNEEVGEVESYFQDPEAANKISDSPQIGDIDDDKMNEVVFGTENGNLYVLNNKGEIEWKFETKGPIRSSPLLRDIDGDGMLEIIFGSLDGNLYVVSARGELKWKHETDTDIECTPQLVGEKIVFGCHDGSIRCVEYKGEEEWRFETDDKVVAQPAVDDLFDNGNRIIVVGSTDYNLYALDEKGNLVWEYPTRGAILSKANIADLNDDGKKEIVFGSCDNNVYAITSHGDTIWSYETYFWVVAPPLVEDIDGDGNKEVIVGSYDHNLYVLDSKGFYSLDYVPGLGGVVHQSGHSSEVMTRKPGDVKAEKIWQYKTNGFIVGCALDEDLKNIVVNVKEGQVQDIVHEA